MGRKLVGAAIAGAALWAAPALAHPGHDGSLSGFIAGLLHPLTGLDHLAAMLMVGLWAGLVLDRRATWAPPLAFVACMLAGFAWGRAGGMLPMTEGLIAASLVVLGLVVCFVVRAPATAAAGLVGLFAFAHGFAHGVEAPGSTPSWHFAAGFALTTALLHAAGIMIGRRAGTTGGRMLGAAGAAGGVLLLLGS